MTSENQFGVFECAVGSILVFVSFVWFEKRVLLCSESLPPSIVLQLQSLEVAYVAQK